MKLNCLKKRGDKRLTSGKTRTLVVYISICFIVNRKDERLWQQQHRALKMGKIKIGASSHERLSVVERRISSHFFQILLSFFLSSQNSWHKIRHIIFFEMSFNILNSLLVLSHLTLNVKRDAYDDGKFWNAIQILTRHFWISRHVFGRRRKKRKKIHFLMR